MEARLYEKQEDGSLKPVGMPDWLIGRVEVYLWARGKGLSMEEVKFLAEVELR